MNWAQLKSIWPHASHSRFVPTTRGAGRWHVQVMGRGPDLLLLHGAGGTTQSYRLLMPRLAQRYRCIAVDFPGQGFSRPGGAGRYSLNAMADDIGALMAREGFAPAAIIGHSAGGALALRMAERTDLPVIGINAALDKFEGLAGWAFPLAARMMALNPLTAVAVSNLTASQSVVDRLLEGTGSQIDATGRMLYRHLAGSAQHVDGTLRMMSGWNLDPLLGRLPRNETPVTLIATTGDRTVPPETSDRAAARLPRAQVIKIARYGHLAHEEAPDLVASHIFTALDQALTRL